MQTTVPESSPVSRQQTQAAPSPAERELMRRFLPPGDAAACEQAQAPLSREALQQSLADLPPTGSSARRAYATVHPRPWRKNSEFGPGPRRPLDNPNRNKFVEALKATMRKAVLVLEGWRGLVRKFVTRATEEVAQGLLYFLSADDGRCDPTYETLAKHVDLSVRTVKRHVRILQAKGFVRWTNRIVRIGRDVRQTSNAYELLIPAAIDGETTPGAPVGRAECQLGTQTEYCLRRVKERAEIREIPVPQPDKAGDAERREQARDAAEMAAARRNRILASMQAHRQAMSDKIAAFGQSISGRARPA